MNSMKFIVPALLLSLISHCAQCFTLHRPIKSTFKLSCVEQPDPPTNQTSIGAITPSLGLIFPVNILTAFYTQHHYHENIMSYKIVLLESLIGVYCYGRDKLLDKLGGDVPNILPFNAIKYVILMTFFNLNANIFDSLEFLLIYEVLKNLIKNSQYLSVKIPIVALGSVFLLASFELHVAQFLPFILLLESTDFYIQIKQRFALIKPFYVSALWAVLVIVAPSVIHDNDYSILSSLDDIVAPFLLIFGLTNIADIKDTEDDQTNGIITFPLYFGVNKTVAISMISILASLFVTFG